MVAARDAGETEQTAAHAREPWAVLPGSVRIIDGVDGLRRAVVAERVWMGGYLGDPQLRIQWLEATLRTEGCAITSDRDLMRRPVAVRVWP